MIKKKRWLTICMLMTLFLIINLVPVSADTLTETAVSAVDLNSKETAQEHTVNYSKGQKSVVPISIPTPGTFLIDLVGDGEPAYAEITDRDGKMLGSCNLSSVASDKTVSVGVSAAGTYYLQFSTESSKTLHTAFSVYYAPTVDKELTGGQLFYAGEAWDVIPCYTVKVPSTGYITMDFAESMTLGAGGKIWVCDPIVNNTIPYDAVELETDKSKGYIGVKKGTYHFNLRSAVSVYGIRALFTPVKNNGGSTRSKAQVLKKGTLKTGASIVNDPSAKEWYKFTLTKAQTVKFSLQKYNNNRVIAFRFYREGKKKSFLYKDVRNRRNSTEFYASKGDTKTKLAAGTYYVEVDNKGTGYYDLTWMK